MLAPVLTAVVVASFAPRTDWYVDAGHPSCATGAGTVADPFCTIGAALALATSGDRVLVAPGTYGERLTVPPGVTLVGTEGAAATIVDGGQAGTVVTTMPGATVVLTGLTVTGGVAGSGAGVRAQGSLELRDSVVRGNATTATGSLEYGGGLWMEGAGGDLLVVNCRFEDNSSLTFGGAIACTEAVDLVIERTHFVDNSCGFEGGAIYAFVDALDLRACEFAGNASTSNAGGAILGAGDLVIDGCTFTGNESQSFGGALEWLGGSALLVNSTFVDNADVGGFGGGGAALLQGMTAAVCRVDHCTFTGNSSANGGGILVAGTGGSGATISNTVMTGNTAALGGDDLFGAATSAGHNVVGQTSGLTLLASDVPGASVGFMPLGDYGGPTRTAMPLPGSLLEDAAAPSSALGFDQRGSVRPAGLADVGAVEVLGRSVACAVVANSVGLEPYLVAGGDEAAAANGLCLVVGNLPPSRFGYFLAGTASGTTVNPGGSLGVQCVAGSIGRLNRGALGEVLRSGPSGVVQLTPDLTRLATPMGTEAVMAGDTRYFQLWYRDGITGPSSNFSAALEVTFR